jgi:hypothetical protein
MIEVSWLSWVLIFIKSNMVPIIMANLIWHLILLGTTSLRHTGSWSGFWAEPSTFLTYIPPGKYATGRSSTFSAAYPKEGALHHGHVSGSSQVADSGPEGAFFVPG